MLVYVVIVCVGGGLEEPFVVLGTVILCERGRVGGLLCGACVVVLRERSSLRNFLWCFERE